MTRYAAEHKEPLALGNVDRRHRAPSRRVLVHGHRAPRSAAAGVRRLVGAESAASAGFEASYRVRSRRCLPRTPLRWPMRPGRAFFFAPFFFFGLGLLRSPARRSRSTPRIASARSMIFWNIARSRRPRRPMRDPDRGVVLRRGCRRSRRSLLTLSGANSVMSTSPRPVVAVLDQQPACAIAAAAP